jgi:hypothetical protein
MKNQKHCEVMVGVSTEQNTTNLVPFIQFGGNHLILAETDEAHAANWTQGLAKVVTEYRGKQFTSISIGIGDNLAQTSTVLSEKLKSFPSICWNFGGGQKIQQLALFDLFTKRLREGKEDWACYSEPKNRLTYIIGASATGNFENTRIVTDAFMTLEEILVTFGNRMKSGAGQCLWTRKKRQESDPSYTQVLSDDYAAWIDDYEKRQNMFRHFDFRLTPPPDGKVIYPNGFTKLGEYFEKVVQRQVFDIISNNSNNHTVNEVWVNVHVFPRDKGGQVAEYDVLLVTNFGTIIPLDAKSYDFETKDEHARLHNLTKVSGRYTTIWSVFPYFQKDLSDGSFLRQDKEWEKLLQRPFELAERKSQMLVVAEKGTSSFIIHRGKRNKVKQIKQEKEGSMTVYTLESLLDRLNLKRKAG